MSKLNSMIETLKFNESDKNDMRKIKIFVNIFFRHSKVMQFEMKADEGSTGIHLLIYAEKMLSAEGYLRFFIERIRDEFDNCAIYNETKLKHLHFYNIHMIPIKVKESDVHVPITIQINKKHNVRLFAVSGSTIMDVVREHFPQVKHIGSVQRWSSTFQMWSCEERSFTVDSGGTRFKIKAVVKEKNDKDREECGCGLGKLIKNLICN